MAGATTAATGIAVIVTGIVVATDVAPIAVIAAVVTRIVVLAPIDAA
jgi:hypothetical protein